LLRLRHARKKAFRARRITRQIATSQ
jgi:hypothetical protein